MSETAAPARLIWALGVTQIIGYGSLYYSFSILAPEMARDVSLPLDWLFAILSVCLLAGGMMAPKAGRWADRFGAARLMAPGSLAAGLALLAAALAPNAFSLGLSLAAMEIASAFVLYGTAFAAIVQAGGRSAQRSITHLTLIAGFASTLFWPLTSGLHEHLSWRMVYMLFAALNILVCLPIHVWVGRLPRQDDPQPVAKVALSDPADVPTVVAKPASRLPSGNLLFALMLAAFAAEGLVLASILVHMVPLLTALGLGSAGLLVSALFGPSQVASRLINMLFGGRLSQTVLAVIAAGLLPLALLLLTATSPWLPGVMVFAVLFGLGSGLTSIVGGTLPLELFGRAGYGARLGWVTAARQFSSALAPFAFAFALQRFGTEVALTIGIVLGAGGLALFAAIAVLRYRAVPPSAVAAPGE
ncbi:arsenite efflux MFS transporter ArsK [Agrobacterium sp. a22-2]|uniref:arsenite efflux MFS transporter ArsK n=1 Tax=Agrobacterium sp. a22-2 TaxID=2283840 RepID=UPI0014468896|nr:arsenite efflux MFS transporter ArsK [Agrobacterium sp. a22-2]NKN39496.1 arsenite efflux MFS transporter ArsK [Agrobacterium sp. a22-2]